MPGGDGELFGGSDGLLLVELNDSGSEGVYGECSSTSSSRLLRFVARGLLSGKDRSAIDDQAHKDNYRDKHENHERTDRALLRDRTLHASHPAQVTER